ncbi:L-amino acid N-acyltransferase YncA [Bacillus tianshenii]|uniref:L-amino acid N-acyltransferase YncA n=1 Tax=Sutcliffiella tianshenii TaxID=1463404 RepID=A0ABS2P697_9BACI|nr:GNAT family N-acetyltransferase [Bacillus tianshenii]MBM7622428.1 L-amino acid N-acyltransferase YncA [Bacillus tianshenii]MCA1321860.1 GNAT family N-acetyltransferase [Bacillus tianshenii]
MIIRLAKKGDEASIARVHVDSWKTTYKGIVEDSYLETLSYDNRKSMWEKAIQAGHEKSCLFVAEVEGDIVGFASAGPERTKKYKVDGELYAIYILKDFQKRGIGKALYSKVRECLIKNGYKSMLVWVLADNPSRNFYLSLEPQEIDTENIQIGNQAYEEIAYGWNFIGV